MIKKSRLRWFGHVERKDDNDWVKRCITWEVEGCPKRMHSPGINGEGELRGQPANAGSPRKMAVKMECVTVCVCVWMLLTNQYQLECALCGDVNQRRIFLH